jgi:signal transduction histidine kinase
VEVLLHIGRRWMIGAASLVLANFFFGSPAFPADPKRVLLLHSFGRDFKPWSEYARMIRTELDRQSHWPLDVVEYSLVTARFGDENPEAPFVDYLRAVFANRPLDLIVSVGAPAAGFVQRHRHNLFAATPMVFTAVEYRRVQLANLTENDALVAVTHDLPAIIDNILRVLPKTKTIAIVNGNSPLENFWREEMRNEFKRFEHRVSFKWYNSLSFEEILRDAATLPANSAIFWELMIVDGAGVVHEGPTALAKLHSVANAPIFSFDDSFFGSEAVGGPMFSVLDISRRAAAVAVRILGGEKASAIKTSPIGFAAPKFDWREMQRWGIDESRLPPESQVYFREPAAWEQYRFQILAVVAIVVLQGTLIFWLAYEHRRRNRAEVLARNSIFELAHLNRVATAGELSATIAHEVNQPITGIVTRAGAALNWLSRENPNIGKAQDLLGQIIVAGHRASEVVTTVRAMFRKDRQASVPIDINRLISSVLGLVYIDLRKHSIETRIDLDARLPDIIGNEVQLQQVMLNLLINAVEAMSSTESRVLQIRSELAGKSVRVSVEDSGSGIDPTNIDRVFKPMFTTKAQGMGMGLSICRSIIVAHDGRISVSPAASGGTIFRFELPVSARATADADRQPEIAEAS